jgi:RHS repeat-associated protein
LQQKGSRSSGKERDTETGLYYFGARYLSAAQGRFTTPDKPFADQHPQDPQSWNLFSYTRNNPLKYIDTNGRKVFVADQKALSLIRLTLPSDIRAKIALDNNGFINKQAISKIKSKDANFAALLSMVENDKTAIAITGPSSINKNGDIHPFKYESDATGRKLLKDAGVDVESDQIIKIGSKTKDYSIIATGKTYASNESKSGQIEAWVADGTGDTSDAPEVILAETMAEELYVHAKRLMENKPADHDDGGPIDKETIQFRINVRKNLKEPNK